MKPKFLLLALFSFSILFSSAQVKNIFSLLLKSQEIIAGERRIVNDSTLFFNWDKNTNSWILVKRQIFEYDQKWQTLSYTTYVKLTNKSTWVPVDKKNFINNTIYVWDVASTTRRDSIKTTYSGDIYIMEKWNKKQNKWEYYAKGEYIRDNWGDYAGVTNYLWDNIQNVWERSFKTEVWAGNTSTIEYTSKWNDATNQWENYEQAEIIYNNNSDIESITFYTYNSNTKGYDKKAKDNYIYHDPPNDNNFSVEIISSIWENNSWQNSEREIAYFGWHNLTSINEHAKDIIRIYPNPFNNFIYIENFSINCVTEFYLYDCSGKIIIKKTIDGSQYISTQQLPAGLYFYQLKNNNRFYSGKIVK